MTTDELSELDVLAREGRNLTKETAAVTPTFGRTAEVEALARALAGRKSAVLLGPPGVGKSAIVRKLVELVAKGRIRALEGSSIWEIATTHLVSGTRYTGMQEEKISALLKHATPTRLVYVSDLWNITVAGSYDTNPRGVYDLMRPGIEAEKLVLFGEMSQGRWDKLCREFPMLERDFATITVDPTDEEETRDLLARVAAEAGPEVVFERAAIERVYQLSRKFLPTMSFPGKGVDLLRKVAQAHAGSTDKPRRMPIDETFVDELFAKQTGLPMHMISPRVAVSYDEMVGFLSERVLGQDEGVRAVSDVLALYKTGLSNPEQPAGVLLLVGPTGVGKTELAKATAEFLFGSRERIFRVDLSEYKDFHSFEKLIGDPRKGTTGLLTDHVRKNPFSVVLLDEFEKGHTNIADLFLQVFDDGRLTDAYGETVGFHHALILLTSNVGSDVASLDQSIGFAGDTRPPGERLEARVRRALEQHYRPEFLNRIDRVIVMKPLRRDDLRRITRRELGKVYRREGLVERDLLLEVDDGVIDLLLDKGTDPKYGARPLKRAIEDLVMVPLARALLGAGWRRFQLLRVARSGDEVSITFEPTEASRRLDNLERRGRVSDGEGGTINLSLADVRLRIGHLYEQLGKLEEAADLPGMKRELAELEAKESSPAFWEDAFGHAGTLVRRHRLSVEIRRLEILRGELEAVRELAEASFLEADDSVASELTDTFARLVKRVDRAHRELVQFDERDQGDATVVVTPAGAQAGAATWAKELSEMYTAWAKERGYDVAIAESDGAFFIRVLGAYALGYLRGEEGGHRIVLPPPTKSDRRGEAHLARVEVLAPTETPKDEVRLEDIAPIRTYDLWRSHGVRDRVTGTVDGDVRRVLGGRIDAFLEAHADRRGAA
ncbi:MAG: AAA domain-containing protein [Polyangiaceae bacterium]|nr:AAA domain-containing protein [Polyangiaceae bacterium]